MVLEGPLLAELVEQAFITATLLMRVFLEERQVAMLLLLEVLVLLVLEHHMVQVLALVAVE
jgi:hypothetical protein